MKGQGLLAGMLVAMLVFAGTAAAQDVSVFHVDKPTLDNKFGIEATGSFSMFALDDINDFFLLRNDRSYSVEEAEFGIGGGAALLYRSHERFRWHIGYAFLGQETARASYFDATEGTTLTDEQTVSGSELYLSGNYLFPFGETLTVYLGAGISVVSAEFDRASATSAGIFNADGRGFGARATLGAELMLTEMFGLTGALGYRMANVPSVAYEDRTLVDEDGNPLQQTVYWGAGNRKIAVDFSGAYAELGLRLYFDPATNWFRP